MRKLFILFALFIAGCMSLPPLTAEDKVMHAQAQITAAYNTVADLAEQGRITKEQGKEMLTLVDEAKAALILAKSALGTSAEEGQLRALSTILLKLETTLKEKQNVGYVERYHFA